jgi:hypothetical protein
MRTLPKKAKAISIERDADPRRVLAAAQQDFSTASLEKCVSRFLERTP